MYQSTNCISIELSGFEAGPDAVKYWSAALTSGTENHYKVVGRQQCQVSFHTKVLAKVGKHKQ